MRNKRDVIHWRQIPTKSSTIGTELKDRGTHAVYALLKCMSCEPDSFQQKNYIIAAASTFERLSCLVYFGKEGCYRKPPVSKYYKEIFEANAETPEEVHWRVQRYGVTKEKAEHIFKLVWQIADLVCPMMACIEEQAFVSEYAYAIEYVIKHGGDLPKPEMGLLFPRNYKDYNYEEGIAELIRDYEFN